MSVPASCPQRGVLAATTVPESTISEVESLGGRSYPTESLSRRPALLSETKKQKDEDDSAWQVLAGNIALCLIKSDLKRDSGFDGSSTGWTSWVEESSAFRLQKCLDKLIFSVVETQSQFKPSVSPTSSAELSRTLQQRDELIRWIRWIKTTPSPTIMELSEPLRAAVNASITNETLAQVDQTEEAFLSRIACRIVVLPSGGSLLNNLRTAPGAMVYGKQLFGGATRYRMIGSSTRQRKAGERTVLASPGESVDAWLQYGGPERNYDAVDMGPCALMELTIVPKGLTVPTFDEMTLVDNGTGDSKPEMIIMQSQCNPQYMFEFPSDSASLVQDQTTGGQEGDILQDPNDSSTISEVEYLDTLESTFTTVLGGLGKQIEAIIRRVLDGRLLAQKSGEAKLRAEEMQAMLDLGLQPVRGLLLYGPPGTGKTALAREISRLLTERPPKIVSAPELLDRWVGGSEKLVRDLFGDAETELNMCNGDISKSGLHVIVIDEIDAVFRQRSSAPDSGEVARASAVNQILAKLDGVNSLGNVLVIATTNRRELLDDALLRPGRLEVQVEVPLPDKEGRREILQIHFDALRRRGRLSQPLCAAIDGTAGDTSRKRKIRLPRLFSTIHLMKRGAIDLAADRYTRGFSGANLQGLVRCAGSIALSRARQDGSGIDGLLITVDDVLSALEEIKE